MLLGNSAESGSGGGLRLQLVNGSEVSRFPSSSDNWWGVTVTNNIIANNVAGWDGGGVSLLDALKVKFVNNTVISNDTTASSGVLFNTVGASQGSTPPPGCDPNTGAGCINPVTTSKPQPSGLSSQPNTSNLIASLPATLDCPSGFGYGSNSALVNGSCRAVSLPLIQNDLFWQNRAFNITVTSNVGNTTGNNLLNQQNLVTLVPALNQGQTGSCPGDSGPGIITGGTGTPSYWDIGVRGDIGPGDHSSGFTLSLTHSILTSFTGGYSGNSNIAPSASGVISQYCNGSRIPPENGGLGFAVPPGISDNTLPSPVFNLQPTATVDEGNNWVNLSYGPLTLTNLSRVTLGNYSITSASAAVDSGDETGAPNHDFFGHSRPQGAEPDIGAVELIKTAAADLDVSPSSLNFGAQTINTTSASQFVTVSSTGSAGLTGISASFTGPFQRASGNQSCGTTLASGSTCRIYVVFHPTAPGPSSGTMTINSNDTSPDAAADRVVALSGTGLKISASPTTLMLVSLGSGLSQVQNVTVRNAASAGSGSTGPISATITGGSNGGIFSIASNNCPATGLLPGQSCQIGVQFRSSRPFSLSTATLNVSDTEPATVSVGLTGLRVF
jgi:hypothetical protein